MNFKHIFGAVKATTIKKSPEILIGVGIAGLITSTVLAVTATPKALLIIDEYKLTNKKDQITPKEAVKTTWKCYLPAAITMTISAALIIFGDSIHLRRNAAMLAAYTAGETAIKNYKNKVIETIGEKKEKEIRDKVAQDEVDSKPVSQSNVINTGLGDTLFYDSYSGRYFRHSINAVEKAINTFNGEMLNVYGCFLPLNRLYELLGLPSIKLGNYIGWAADREGQIDWVNSGSWVDSDIGEPCKYLEFWIDPRNYES